MTESTITTVIWFFWVAVISYYVFKFSAFSYCFVAKLIGFDSACVTPGKSGNFDLKGREYLSARETYNGKEGYKLIDLHQDWEGGEVLSKKYKVYNVSRKPCLGKKDNEPLFDYVKRDVIYDLYD